METKSVRLMSVRGSYEASEGGVGWSGWRCRWWIGARVGLVGYWSVGSEVATMLEPLGSSGLELEGPMRRAWRWGEPLGSIRRSVNCWGAAGEGAGARGRQSM
jgi:hypothetical protein